MVSLMRTVPTADLYPGKKPSCDEWGGEDLAGGYLLDWVVKTPKMAGRPFTWVTSVTA